MSETPIQPAQPPAAPAPAPAPQPAPAAPAGGGFPRLPQWVYIVAMLLGIPLTGVGGSYYGANEAQKDVADLNVKVEKLETKFDDGMGDLDKKIDKLIIAIIRSNPDLEIDL